MSKKILFVRSGGSIPGLGIHAGIWLALSQAGIHSTHNSGTSAGACISAFDSTLWTAEDAVDFLRGLKDKDLRNKRIFWKLRLAWISYIHKNNRILEQLNHVLPEKLSHQHKPLCVWATRAWDNEKHNVAGFGYGDSLPDAVMASMSIPSIFPSVKLQNENYIDGGIRFNLPLLHNWREFDEVYLLIAQGRRNYHPNNGSILTRAIRILSRLMGDQILDILDETHGAKNVHVIWPQVKSNKGMLHLNHDLIGDAYAQTKQIIQSWEKK